MRSHQRAGMSVSLIVSLLAVSTALASSSSNLPLGSTDSTGLGTDREEGVLSRSAVNYASAFLGAKVVDFHEGVSQVHHILNDDPDKYMRIPCAKSRKRFTIQLSREIQINMLALNNDEFFSSSIKNFTVVGSREYPCRPPECMWRVLGSFLGAQTRDLQLFPVGKHPPARYVRVLWVTHHGLEKSCTLTRFQVYGVDVLDNLASELSHTITETTTPTEPDTEDDDDGEEVVQVPVASDGSPQLNGTAVTADGDVVVIDGGNSTGLPNGTVLVSAGAVCPVPSSLDNATHGANATANRTANGSGDSPTSVAVLVKKKKDKPKRDRPPPLRNESAILCVRGDQETEEYYGFGRGATCAVPTGKKPRTMTTAAAKLSATTIQLVLPQQQKLLKALQVNISKMGLQVHSMGEKLVQCRADQEVGLQAAREENTRLQDKLKELQDKLDRYEHRLNNAEMLHTFEVERTQKKISNLSSYTETGFLIIAFVLIFVILWSLVLNHGVWKQTVGDTTRPRDTASPQPSAASPIVQQVVEQFPQGATDLHTVPSLDSNAALDQLEASRGSLSPTPQRRDTRGNTSSSDEGVTPGTTGTIGAEVGHSPRPLSETQDMFGHRPSEPDDPRHHRLATLGSTDELVEVDELVT